MTAVTIPLPGTADLRRPAWARTLWLLVGLGVLLVLCILSICFGVRSVSIDDIFAALAGQDDTLAQAAIIKRFPRTVLAILDLGRESPYLIQCGSLGGAPQQVLVQKPVYSVTEFST